MSTGGSADLKSDSSVKMSPTLTNCMITEKSLTPTGIV